jgi:hypothetical protein
MRTYPAHIATLSAPEEPFEDLGSEAPAAPADRVHPLAAQLRQALENPLTTDVGTFARIVDQIMGEFSMADGDLEAMHEPARARRPERAPTRTYIPMSEAEEQRIVDYFVARQAGMDKSAAH